MRLSEGNPFKTCANPQAHNQKTQPSNRLWEQIGLNISRCKPFRCISYNTGQDDLLIGIWPGALGVLRIVDVFLISSFGGGREKRRENNKQITQITFCKVAQALMLWFITSSDFFVFFCVVCLVFPGTWPCPSLILVCWFLVVFFWFSLWFLFLLFWKIWGEVGTKTPA